VNDKDQQHLAAIVRDSNDAIIGKTLEGIITSWNGGAERIYGYTAKEAIGRTVAMLVPPDREDELPEILRNLTMGEGINCYETLRVRKDGRLVNISLTVSPIRDTSGAITGASSIGRDVTKEKEAEAALRESARAYKLLMEQAADAILVSYPDQPVIEVNQRASDMLGYTREELFQLHGQGSVLREGLSALLPLPDEILKGDIVYAEHPVRRKDGTVIVTELSSRRLDDGRIVTIARDITERKRAEEALRETEARLRSAIDIAQLSFYEWNPQTDELSWDVRLKEIWGLPPDTSVDVKLFLAGVHLEDRESVQAAIARSNDPAGGGQYSAEYRVIGQEDKQQRWVAARGKTFFEGNVAVRHVGVTQDITERKQAEEALARSEAELRALFAAMTDVVLVLDAQGRYLQIAPTTPDFLYKPPADLLGRTIHEVLPTANADNILHRIGLALEKQQPVNVEYSLPIGDSEVWFEGTVSPMGEDKVFWIARDVTERKRAEESLRLSSEILQRVKSLVLVTDKDGQVTYVNQSVKALLGYEPHELLGDGWWQVSRLDLDEGQKERAHILNFAAHATAVTSVSGEPYERIVLDKNGELHWILWQDVIGPNSQVIGVGHDITERKQAELAVQNSEKRFRALIEHNAEAIILTNSEGIVLYASPSATQVLGTRHDEMIGLSGFSRLHPDDVARATQLLGELLQKPGASMPFEARFQHRDDTWHWIEGTGTNLLDEPAVQACVGNYRDITERKEAEENLRESEERFRLMFASNPLPMWVYDAESLEFLEVNEAAIVRYGYSRNEFLSMRITDIRPIEETPRLMEHLANVRPALQSSGEWRHQTKAGQIIDVRITSHIFAFGGHERSKSAILVVAEDITERKRVEEARLAKEAAEEANRAKNEFLSRMSHELRTPLNAILGFGQLLQMDSSTPEQQESVDYILKAGQHLLSLINEVLDIARIEEGKLTISIEPVLVREVLQESLDLMQPLAAHRNIELNADVALMANCYVRADRQRLQQVLLNLIANAIKYNCEGGEVNVSCSELGHEADGQDPRSPELAARVRIVVSDNGPGLSPDKVARLFIPFERLGAERGDVEGTGLGLALSRHLVQAMGGAIGVESEQGMGCTFWVELSRAEEQMPGFDLTVTSPLFNIQVGEQARTVLYIEDNLSNLRLIERILSKRPEINLITAMQGQMGLDMAYEHRPDLILLDLHLPDMTGDQVLGRLREDTRTASIPVVVLSADANPQQVDKLLEAGARAYLAKPLNVKQLLKVLQEITAQSAG
jgi:PAS domain S-box-containing protein